MQPVAARKRWSFDKHTSPICSSRAVQLPKLLTCNHESETGVPGYGPSQGRKWLDRLVEPMSWHDGHNHRSALGCSIVCLVRIMQPTVRAVAQPRGTAGPGGGPSDGVLPKAAGTGRP
ncbi:hypothetical protein F511_41285 [Dorcoceras hygrometricum]|uniref:Uncharacterized protein n=1 Tax=Dorcoceras hygrometricum TaxID=472368 RepID=A0A2Z7AHS0_9LAMI|nr:hypothetical protein F511_41285 [Dorcoceras hygrometricum]